MFNLKHQKYASIILLKVFNSYGLIIKLKPNAVTFPYFHILDNIDDVYLRFNSKRCT